jgi:hypothetical protein
MKNIIPFLHRGSINIIITGHVNRTIRPEEVKNDINNYYFDHTE